MCCEEGDCLFITNSFLLTGSVFVESRVDSRGDYSYLTDPGEVWPRKHNIGGHRTLPPGQENISNFKILQSNVFSKSYLHHQKWDFLQIRIHMHRKVMPASKSPEPDRETKGRFSTGVRQRYFPGKPHLSLRSQSSLLIGELQRLQHGHLHIQRLQLLRLWHSLLHCGDLFQFFWNLKYFLFLRLHWPNWEVLRMSCISTLENWRTAQVDNKLWLQMIV